MKETNMEHYRGEIEEIMARNKHCLPAVAVVDGKPIECKGLRCNKCMLYEVTEPCSIHFVKWLMSEYKPEPVLAQREKGFVECIRHGWIAADEVGSKMWYEDKPKKDWEPNVWLGKKPVTLNDDYFPFITWEDEEPWSVEDLRKLKVKGGVADE